MKDSSLFSYWFIILEVCMAIVAAYLIVKLFRKRPESQSEAKSRKPYFIVLAALQLIVIIATIVWPLLGSRIQRERVLDRVEVRVSKTSPASVFGGDLNISLIETNFENQSGKYTVRAIVSSPSYQDLPIENEGSGYQVSYSGKDIYEIRILSADKLTAKFLVTLKAK